MTANAPDLRDVLSPKQSILDRPLDRCPICHIKLPIDRRQAYCSHMKWKSKFKRFVLRNQKKHDDVQKQKYALNPMWRRRR